MEAGGGSGEARVCEGGDAEGDKEESNNSAGNRDDALRRPR